MVVTFGELLMRLSPPDYKRIRQTQSLNIDFGGAEANTAVSLAQFGIDSKHISVLPANDIGYLCRSELMRYGVDASGIQFDSDETARMGLYYYEKGASQRPSRVIYDRKDSSLAKSFPNQFDWEKILENADWFHFTGITPALSTELQKSVMSALKTAKKYGVPISCDLNYRAKLWDKQTAGKVMAEYMPYINLLFANSGSIFDLFGIGTDDYGLQENIDTVVDIAKQVNARYGTDTIALTMRKTLSASQNLWSALSYSSNEMHMSKQYTLDIIDRIGGGDSFAAGYIYGKLQKMSEQDTLEFATSASCLKHSILGDFNITTVDEVMSLVKGDSTGNIKR